MVDEVTENRQLAERMRGLFPTNCMAGIQLTIRDVSYESGTAEILYEVDSVHANQLGNVQGGIVAGMLDGCIGISGSVKSGGVLAMPLAEMKTSFVRAVPLGRVVGKGQTLKLGKNLAFIEGSLFSEDGKLLARASGTAFPVPFPDSAYK